MIEEHLNYLIEIGDNEQGFVGNNSLRWGVSVLGQENDFDPYLDRQFDRHELFEYCNDNNNNNNNNINVLVAILSWGGMRRDHGRLLMNHFNHIEPLINNLRNNVYQTRTDAFNAFQNIRIQGNLPGLGIGYFTKLICFLSPNLNGYIMDQWVSKSINLLTGQQIVNLTNNSWVNDNNTANTYEIFCQRIDELAILLDCNGFEAEKRIFSVGRGNGLWRNYLIELNN